MPLVVLEGADGSGKSTLAHKLLKGTGQPTLLVKRSGPPGSIETLVFMSEWLSQQGRIGLNIIADRHPIISEAIYGPVVRKAPGPYWSMEDAYRALKRHNILLVYCRTDMGKLLEGAQQEDQMAGVHQYYWDLVKEYDRWMDYFQDKGIAFYQYNWANDQDATKAIKNIRTFWEGKWKID
jgi:deoxyadenosine/deoxycytidine kinase